MREILELGTYGRHHARVAVARIDHAIPEQKSIQRLPSTSQICIPSARAANRDGLPDPAGSAAARRAHQTCVRSGTRAVTIPVSWTTRRSIERTPVRAERQHRRATVFPATC